MAGVCRQLFAVEELCAAVALAERMDIVYVAHDDRGFLGKFGSAQAFEKICFLKAAVNVAHADLDELPELELVAVLGDFDGTKLAGPIKNILEKMPVNGAQVRQVKNPSGDALGGALDNERPLYNIETIGVLNSNFVAENDGARIEVRIVAGHSAAKAPTAARM